MSSQLEQVIQLIQKTGDRCIVFNPQTEESYVVMNLEEYKRIILNEDNLAKNRQEITQEPLPEENTQENQFYPEPIE